MDPIKSAESGTSEHGWTRVESRRKQKQLATKQKQLARQKQLEDNERRKERNNKHMKAKENRKPEAAKNNIDYSEGFVWPDSSEEFVVPDGWVWPDSDYTVPDGWVWPDSSESEKPKRELWLGKYNKWQISFLVDLAIRTKAGIGRKEVSLAEAAAEIDVSDLAAYLADSPNWNPDSIVLNLVDYFGYYLADVSSEQFKYPWRNMNNLTEVADIPFTHIPAAVYKTAADWLERDARFDAVCAFVLMAFGFIHDRLVGRPTSPINSQLAYFVVISIILRSNPVVLLTILPHLREAPYQTEDAHDMFPLTVWMMAQISKDDICAGLYSWSRNLLPLVGDKNKCKPESLDLALQLVEKIVSHPCARATMLFYAVKDEKERLIPLSSFEILMRLTFPDTPDRDTKRFEALYPLLKEVALADAPEMYQVKLVTQPIFALCFKFAGEGKNPFLAEEATKIAIWCLTKSVDCCRPWDDGHDDNLQGSVALLKRLVDEWKEHSRKLLSSRFSIDLLKQTMNNFRLKNKHGIITEQGPRASLYKEADKYVTTITAALMN